MVTSEGQGWQPGLLRIHLACKMSTTKVTLAKSFMVGGSPGEVAGDRAGTCTKLPFLPYISRPRFLQILNVTLHAESFKTFQSSRAPCNLHANFKLKAVRNVRTRFVSCFS